MSVIINIGRNQDNDIVLPEQYISAHHAQLIKDENGKWFIHDLQSSNGSFVNGIKVLAPVEITENDLILLGGSLLPWKDIFNKYELPAAVEKTYKSKLYHYLLALGAAIALFSIFLLVNEFFLTGWSHASSDSTGSSGSKKETRKLVPKNITYDFSCVKFADDTSVNNIANKFDSLHSRFDKSDRGNRFITGGNRFWK